MSCLIPRLPLLLVLDDWMDAGLSGLSASEKLARWGNEWYLEIGNLSMLINDNTRRSAAAYTYMKQVKMGQKSHLFLFISPSLMEWVALSVSIKWNAVAWLELYPFHLNLFKEGSKTIRPRRIRLWNFG